MRGLLLLIAPFLFSCEEEKIHSRVDGQHCMKLVQKQLDFGPRLLNSEAAKITAEWIF